MTKPSDPNCERCHGTGKFYVYSTLVDCDCTKESMESLRARVEELEEQIRFRDEAMSEQTKDYAEWMPPEDYVQMCQEINRLERIASHVPAKVYIAAREAAGFGIEINPQVIPDSGGHTESPDCWCGPTVEDHPGGTLIIHNQTH